MLLNRRVVLVQQFDVRRALADGGRYLVDDAEHRAAAAVNVVEVVAVEIAKVHGAPHSPEQPPQIFVGLVIVGRIVALPFDFVDAGLHSLDVAPARPNAHSIVLRVCLLFLAAVGA